MKSHSIYNKLAFNGYRIFLIQPPNWQLCRADSIGMLSYRDINRELYETVKEAMGFYPSAQEIAEWYASRETHMSRPHIRYRPAFVNDREYKPIWSNPWYIAKSEEAKNKGSWAKNYVHRKSLDI